MDNETESAKFFDTATTINDLLTQRGIEARMSPFMGVGNPVDRKSGFVGKEDVVNDMVAAVETSGIAIIEGAPRSGKTSLLGVVGKELVRKNVVGRVIFIDLFSCPNTPPNEVLSQIKSKIADPLQAAGNDNPNILVVIDEIGSYNPTHQVELLSLLDKLKDGGHKILMSTIGDLNGDSRSEIPRVTKDKITAMSDGNVINDRLLDHQELADLINLKGVPVFQPGFVSYLTTESGGHPYLAQKLAESAFDLLNIDEVEPRDLRRELRRDVGNSSVLNNFSFAVDLIISAGYDPVTWEWSGSGQQPNINVYKNMIPSASSGIFNEWLHNYLQRHGTKRI